MASRLKNPQGFRSKKQHKYFFWAARNKPGSGITPKKAKTIARRTKKKGPGYKALPHSRRRRFLC